MLATGDDIEPSTAVELYERAGWSLDTIATVTRAGLGIARDLTQNIDLGAYATTPYTDWDPALSIGLNWTL